MTTTQSPIDYNGHQPDLTTTTTTTTTAQLAGLK